MPQYFLPSLPQADSNSEGGCLSLLVQSMNIWFRQHTSDAQALTSGVDEQMESEFSEAISSSSSSAVSGNPIFGFASSPLSSSVKRQAVVTDHEGGQVPTNTHSTRPLNSHCDSKRHLKVTFNTTATLGSIISIWDFCFVCWFFKPKTCFQW